MVTWPGGGPAGRAAVFLDRDGVVNRAPVVDGTPRAPRSVHDVVLLPLVDDACRRLKRAGLLLVVVTNQPDIARGLLASETLSIIHGVLRRRLPIDDVLVCPHDDADCCDCRKPAPGLLHEAAQRWGVELRRSVMVGDRWRDVQAGRAAGCATVLVDHHYSERRVEADLVVHGLHQAVPWILDRIGVGDEVGGRCRA